MENDTYHFISLPYGRQSAVRTTASVEGNPNLVAGLLLGYFFIGLASYFWAFWSQYSRLTAFKEAITMSCSVEPRSVSGIQKIYKVIPSLVFIDIVNAITAIILAIEFFGSCRSALSCTYLLNAWYLSRCFGTILHLVSALVCLLVLCMCNPQLEARPCIINTCVVVLMTICSILYIYVSQFAIIGLGASTIGLALAIIANCLKSTASPSTATWKRLIVLLAMLTFGIVFVPTFIGECLVMNAVPPNNYIIFYLNALFYTNLQLLMNGLLCYAILKLPSEEEEQQQQQGNMENINNAH